MSLKSILTSDVRLPSRGRKSADQDLPDAASEEITAAAMPVDATAQPSASPDASAPAVVENAAAQPQPATPDGFAAPAPADLPIAASAEAPVIPVEAAPAASNLPAADVPASPSSPEAATSPRAPREVPAGPIPPAAAAPLPADPGTERATAAGAAPAPGGPSPVDEDLGPAWKPSQAPAAEGGAAESHIAEPAPAAAPLDVPAASETAGAIAPLAGPADLEPVPQPTAPLDAQSTQGLDAQSTRPASPTAAPAPEWKSSPRAAETSAPASPQPTASAEPMPAWKPSHPAPDAAAGDGGGDGFGAAGGSETVPDAAAAGPGTGLEAPAVTAWAAQAPRAAEHGSFDVTSDASAPLGTARPGAIAPTPPVDPAADSGIPGSAALPETPAAPSAPAAEHAVPETYAQEPAPEVRVARSPVPPVRKIAPEPAVATAPGASTSETAADPVATAPAMPAAKPAKRGLASRNVRLPSLRRRTDDGPAVPKADAAAGERAGKRAVRLGVPASLGIYGLRKRDESTTETPDSGRSPARKFSVPSVSSLRGMQLGLPHRGRDGGVLVGLDIQPGSAVAVRVARNGRLHVEEAVGVALPAGVVREGEVIDSEALGAALRTMFDGSKLPRRVRVGIAGQRCVMRTLEVPPLKDKKELAQAVAFTASQEMPMPLESALTDFQSLGQVETKTGPRERIVFVAAHQEPVGKLLDALRRAGLTAGGLDLSAFALIRSLHEPSANGASDGCKLYVNVDGLTNIAIADDTTCLFTRAATVGAESMAGELAGARSIPLEQARGELVTTNLLDLENDQTVDARTVLRDGLRDVAAEVRAALDFHSSQEGEPVTGLVLSGALAQVRGFADELGQTLGYDVTVREVDAGDGATVTPCRLAVAAGLSVAEVAQ